MRATVGDRIVIASGKVEGAVRDGEVIEVRSADGSPPYVVRWSDGHEGLFFPGADAMIQQQSAATSGNGPTAAQDTGAAPVTQVKSWQVEVQVVERQGITTAHAVLRGGAPESLDAEGEARLNPSDADVPRIGDEVAVARALRRLADRLSAAAEEDIRQSAGGGEVHLRG